MKIFRKYSQRSVLSLTVAALVSGAFQSFLFSSNNHVIAATITQSNRRDEETRPRRVAEPKKPAANADGPMIRIGLLVDATSVSVSSPSGIIARRSEEDNESEAVSQLRVEVRRNVVVPADRGYRVEVAKVSDARAARKLTDELKKKFDEPVATEQVEETDEYRILIGRFKSRREADAMAERLRDEKYKSARVALDSQVTEKRPAVGSRYQQKAVIDKASADETELRYRESADKSDIRSTSRETALVALNANKMIASSEDSIILAPAQSAIESFGKRDTEIQTKKSIDRPPALKVNGKDYRGEIQMMINRRGRINVINSLPLEQYLRGVVPLELSPGSFPQIEALKAQAVAARSYALSHFGRYNSEGFDLSDDTRSQVYGGLSAEQPLTNRAVEDTRGVVAVYIDSQGRAVPIQALYTSTCGGQTEDNESVFLTEPVSYLRSVTCAPDSRETRDREIKSSRTVEPVAGADGHSATRDIALMDVLGFKLPSRVTSQYLRSSADQDEVVRWAERATVLARRSSLRVPRGDVTRLTVFASLIAAAFYGESRESLLFSPADTDYILAGIVADDIPRDTRADLALLLKDGILRLPADSRIGAKTSVTRAFAIETIARALYLKSQISNLKSQTVQAVENNRLVINTTQSNKGSSSRSTSSQSATTIEIEKSAWLFRRIGGESYSVDRLAFVGGERISYHLNSAGRIDFLEAEMSERGAASDRFSNVGRWKERIGADELKRRLSRSRVAVGDIEDLVATARGKSNRVMELEIVGSEGRSYLKGSRVRSALGLRETLFVVEPERDEQGHIAAFVFTGRGWGHGVGMCQTGAYGLAKEGYSYRAIIQKYYTGVRLQKTY